MTIYGVRIEKESDGVDFMNRYYVQQPSMFDAITFGENVLVPFEKSFHSNQVRFRNVHVWQPFTSPNTFSNKPMAGTGEVVAGLVGVKHEIVVQMRFGTPSGYPNYKHYRTRVPAGLISGTRWSNAYLNELYEAIGEFQENLGGGALVTRIGVPLGIPVADEEYTFHQLSPKWYNRGTA